MDATYKALAESRRQRRRALDLSLGSLSAEIGVAESTLHRWERGSRRPDSRMDAAWDNAIASHETAAVAAKG